MTLDQLRQIYREYGVKSAEFACAFRDLQPVDREHVRQRVAFTPGLVVNIRGTNASGKTWITRKLIDAHNIPGVVHPTSLQYPPSPNPKSSNTAGGIKNFRKPNLYATERFAVVGRYAGGVDGWYPHEVIDALIDFHQIERPSCHMMFEAVLMSHTFTRWIPVIERSPTPWVFLFLDTPWALCRDRVLARRAEGMAQGKKYRQTNEELNVGGHWAHWWATRRCAVRGAIELGLDIRWLDYRDPYPGAHALLCGCTPDPFPTRWRPSKAEAEEFLRRSKEEKST